MKKTYASDSGGAELGLQLEVAAENGHFEIVQKLIRAGVNVNFKSNWGEFALFHAGKHCHSDIFAAHIQAGATTEEIDVIKILDEANQLC